MVDETQPATGMLEKDVQTLLKGLSLLVMKNVFRLESLIDRQIDGIVRIGNAGLMGTRRFLLLQFTLAAVHIAVNNIVLALLSSMLAFHGGGHSFVMGLAETGRSKSTEKRESRRGLLLDRATVVGVLGLASRCL